MIYNIMDWNGEQYTVLATLETDSANLQIVKNCKSRADKIWNRLNIDWIVIFEKCLKKTNIEYKILQIEDIY